jgi:hypothetical protein
LRVAVSEYVANLRKHVGNGLLILSSPHCQRLTGEIQERHVAQPGLGLGWAENELALNPQELLANRERFRLEIDVTPPQTETFTAS